jgi:molybdopterin-guanine dinucleotide biosynthesis protein
MSRPKIITVSGSHSGIGKTTLIEYILSQLKGWSGLKVTVVKKGPCPREIACGICEHQSSPFTIVSDPKIINQKGKDTERMKSSGAKKVLWLKAKPSGLKEGLQEVLKKFKGSTGVVIEGTSVLKYLEPDLSIFIDGKRKVRLSKCL